MSDEYDEVRDILDAVENGDEDGVGQIFEQYPPLLNGENYNHANSLVGANGNESPLCYAALLKNWKLFAFIARKGYKVGLNEQHYLSMEAFYKLIDYDANFGYDRIMVGRETYGRLRSYDIDVTKIKKKIILMRCIWNFGSGNEFSDLPNKVAQIITDFLWESRLTLRK
jgi:hypothetical protein